LLEAALSAWAGARADRRLVSRFARRRLAGLLAARWLPEEAQLVIAPSLAARRVFAAAARRGASCVLVEDLPGIRGLHLDLDRAAARQPGDAFLRRFRAPPRIVAAQEAERALAQLLLVRSRHALEERLAAGFDRECVLPLPEPPRPESSRGGRGPDAARGKPPLPAGPPGPAAHRPTLLLAGLATARSGLEQALDAAARIPGAVLLVREGEGAPRDLLRRPGVRRASAGEREGLEGVDVVLAPALCEGHPPEVRAAAAAGVPVVATRRAAGFVDLARAGREVEPGDAEGLWRAACDVLGAHPVPGQPKVPEAFGWPAVIARLEQLLLTASGDGRAAAPRASLHARGSP
jgi:hypothetical protein